MGAGTSAYQTMLVLQHVVGGNVLTRKRRAIWQVGFCFSFRGGTLGALWPTDLTFESDHCMSVKPYVLKRTNADCTRNPERRWYSVPTDTPLAENPIQGDAGDWPNGISVLRRRHRAGLRGLHLRAGGRNGRGDGVYCSQGDALPVSLPMSGHAHRVRASEPSAGPSGGATTDGLVVGQYFDSLLPRCHALRSVGHLRPGSAGASSLSVDCRGERFARIVWDRTAPAWLLGDDAILLRAIWIISFWKIGRMPELSLACARAKPASF